MRMREERQRSRMLSRAMDDDWKPAAASLSAIRPKICSSSIFSRFS